MPENNNDVEQENIEEQEPFNPALVPIPEPEPVPQSSKWDWVGSPSRPEAQEEDDGISDLFRVTAEDVGASDDDLSDLTDVDLERDILDADEDGSLDDLVDVTKEDIMGDDDFGQPPQRSQPKYRTSYPRRSGSSRRPSSPPTSLGGMR